MHKILQDEMSIIVIIVTFFMIACISLGLYLIEILKEDEIIENKIFSENYMDGYVFY